MVLVAQVERTAFPQSKVVAATLSLRARLTVIGPLGLPFADAFTSVPLSLRQSSDVGSGLNNDARAEPLPCPWRSDVRQRLGIQTTVKYLGRQ